MRFLSIFLLLAYASLAPAQAVDTTRTYDLDAVVVTADRAVGALAASTAAVSVIETETLRKLPVAGLQDVLETLPGFAFLNVDGQRENPQATIRGFYGGGETEYVVILLDGKPLNGLAQGLPDWQSVPLLGIERVEVLRGASSALYGDAAIGGVVNLVTNGQNLETTTAQLTAGSFGLVTGEFSQRADRYTVYGGIRRLGGYRESSDRQYARIGASYDVLRSATRRLTASTLHSLRNYDDPGALTGEQVEADRRQQALPFRFDGLDERTHRIGLDGRQTTAWGEARVAFAA
ncbi:MAG: TonB-dependent receptor plug domain-containing protein, partial [Bacteroidota bacterium]